MIPKDWPRLLNFPEMRSTAQLEALTKDPIFRQATHVFLYFITNDSVEAFQSIDMVNNSF